MRNLLYVMSVVIVALIGPRQAAAETAPVADKVVLTVTAADGAKKDFTRADLEALGTTVTRTATPWHDGVQTFEGPALDKILAAAGAKGVRAQVTALNKYTIEVPVEDFAKHGVILATKRNGEAMAVKDKGPLFVIYPFDARPDLKTELYYGRSVWQVRSIAVQ